MYVKVLQNCVFGILIFSSEGFSQENIPPEGGPPDDGSLDSDIAKNTPPNGLQQDDNNLSNNIPPGNENTASNDGPPGDENIPLNDDPPGDIPPDAPSYDDPPENTPSNNNAPEKIKDPQYDDDDPIAYDHETPQNDFTENNPPVGSIVPQKMINYDYGAANTKDYEVLLKLPGSAEMLDRNKPEPGFDLTYEEMMKLKLWQDGVIPYYIDVYSFSDKVLRDKIRSFLSSINSLTSLNFIELPSPPVDNSRWVLFINRRGLLGCADHSITNFTNTGVQHVVLGYHCLSTEGELAEAVLAIAGVPPQHNAPDRDYYITINQGNIIPEKKYLFRKLFDDEWLFHDLEYDFNSVGHFHSYKHSVNGRATIEPTQKTMDVTIGESKVLSAIDIQKIRMLYNYIVNKKLLQAPDCHKLFVPGKMFSQYKPSENSLKPRPKPYKYTGETADASLVNDEEIVTEVTPIVEINTDEVDIQENSSATKTIQPSSGEQNEITKKTEEDIPNYDHEYDDNQESKEIVTDKPDDYNYDKEQETTTKKTKVVENQEPNESENISPGDFQSQDGKKATIVSIGKGHIQTLNQIQPILTLKSPIKLNTPKIDLLSFLSDYPTDDENKRLRKTLKKEPIVLKKPQSRLQSKKFTSVG